jgi:hypothetical protein
VNAERWRAARAGGGARAAAGTEWARASAGERVRKPGERRSRRPEHAHDGERCGDGWARRRCGRPQQGAQVAWELERNGGTGAGVRLVAALWHWNRSRRRASRSGCGSERGGSCGVARGRWRSRRERATRGSGRKLARA